MAKISKSAKNETPRADVYERITAKIIEQMEQGVRPWMQPWGNGTSPCRPLRHNSIRYQGINTLLLWMEAAEKGYNSAYWMTYKQAQELGGQVVKGSKSALVVYAGAIEKEQETPSGETVETRIPFMKGYSVFNADQIENLPEHFYFMPEKNTEPKQRIAEAEAFFGNLKADVREGGNQAYYSPVTDHIQMPPFDSFVSAEAHAAILAHEFTHWTAAKNRLDRDLSRYHRDKEDRAREELIAELGSVFLAADLGIEITPREDHAAYLQSWLNVLKNDKRAIFQAASHAERAVSFMHGLQPNASHDQQQEAA